MLTCDQPQGSHTLLPPPHPHRVEEARSCTYIIPGLHFGKEIGFIFLTLFFTSYKL